MVHNFESVKNQHKSKIIAEKMRMVCWMSDKTRRDRIKNGNIRERISVAPIIVKMVETRLRWFGDVQGRPMNVVLRWVDKMDSSQITEHLENYKKISRD